MKDVKWIFFDLGSTIVDERDCFEDRFRKTFEGSSIPYEIFKGRVIEYAKTSVIPFRLAIAKYGLSKPKWNTSLEKLYPDAKKVLEALSHNYKLGLIANQPPGTEKRLKDWGILEYFDIVKASAEEKLEKPSTKIFWKSLEKAGCKPGEAVMVGDRIDNDILPARKIGMKTIWIKQGFAIAHDNSTLPTYTVNSLSDLLMIFDVPSTADEDVDYIFEE